MCQRRRFADMWRNRVAYGVAVVCAVLFYAFYFGYLSLVFLFLAAALPVFSLLFSVPRIRKRGLTLCAPPKTQMGREVFWEVGVTGRGTLPAVKWKLAIVNRNNPQQKRWETRLVRACKGEPVLLQADTAHCGSFQCTVERAWAYDLLGLFRFRLKRPLPVTMTVLPRPERPCPMPAMPDLALSRHMVPKKGGGFAEDYDLRLYRPGDPLRTVHWKLSAKTGELVVREPLEPQNIYARLSLSLSLNERELDSVLGQLYWLSRKLLRMGVSHLVIWSCAPDGKRYAAQLDLGEDIEQLLLLLMNAPADEVCAKRAEAFSRPVDWSYEIRPAHGEDSV